MSTLYTNTLAVQDVLGPNYDNDINLVRPIKSASLLIARMITCAAEKGYTHTSEELTEIANWLAAYYYTKIDPLYSSRSTDDASGSFLRDPENDFKKAAIELDGSGCLNAILNAQRASVGWMGRPPSEQTDYVDRD